MIVHPCSRRGQLLSLILYLLFSFDRSNKITYYMAMVYTAKNQLSIRFSLELSEIFLH